MKFIHLIIPPSKLYLMVSRFYNKLQIFFEKDDIYIFQNPKQNIYIPLRYIPTVLGIKIR